MTAGCGKSSGTKSRCKSLYLMMMSNSTKTQMKRTDLKSSGVLTFKIILGSQMLVVYTNQERVLQEQDLQKYRWQVPKIPWLRLRSDSIKKSSSRNTKMCRLKQSGSILAKSIQMCSDMIRERKQQWISTDTNSTTCCHPAPVLHPQMSSSLKLSISAPRIQPMISLWDGVHSQS